MDLMAFRDFTDLLDILSVHVTGYRKEQDQIDDKPCAFWNGTRYGKTFFTWTTGYDPAFNDDRLGLFLLVKLVEALCVD